MVVDWLICPVSLMLIVVFDWAFTDLPGIVGDLLAEPRICICMCIICWVVESSPREAHTRF